jgi:hypothetical protein
VRFFRGCKGAKAEPQVHDLNRIYSAGYDRIVNPTSKPRLKNPFLFKTYIDPQPNAGQKRIRGPDTCVGTGEGKGAIQAWQPGCFI